jgi:Mn2+/Fe2+ NRAMP family transporter
VLPILLLALATFTSRRSIMGEMVNTRVVSRIAITAAGAVLTLNVVLLDCIHLPPSLPA